MRVDGTRYYGLKDQLSSTSVVTNQSAVTVGEDRFYPFGETRFTTGNMQTDKLFTGQREMVGLCIYHYGARFYSPKIGHFLSADTLMLSPANPQDLNRFSYVRNNPLRYIDPTGHTVACDPYENDCHVGSTPPPPSPCYACDGGTPDNDDVDPNPDSLPAPATCCPGEITCQLETELHCDLYSGYSPCNADWHSYSNANNPNLACPAIYHCTDEEMMNYLLMFAYPNQNPANSVSPGGIYPVGYNGVSLGALGNITVDISDDGLTSVNITLPGHIFYDGTVARTLSQDSDGSWYITTTDVVTLPLGDKDR